jgi:NAD-dependent dihydropyrimidine dehydrogenase PreA subunit
MSKKIFFCNCGAKLIGSERLNEILEYLKQTEHPFVEISDLCGCSVDRKSETFDLFLSADELLIIACYPRGVKLLLENCGINHQNLNLKFVNFRELNNSLIFLEIDSFLSDDATKSEPLIINSTTEWSSWYPIIDYSRCTSCGQCADFCLFGVYDKIDNKVVVVHPKGCKNNCPACGRICPQTAIIFPKYEHPGAIAGSETIDEMAEQQRQSQDIDNILGSNIYKALEMRKAKRQSIIRSTAMQNAIAEREKAMAENKLPEGYNLKN